MGSPEAREELKLLGLEVHHLLVARLQSPRVHAKDCGSAILGCPKAAHFPLVTRSGFMRIYPVTRI